MSPKETLLYRITELMFEKQQTFLLLDELYEDEIISPFVRNIQIDSPYQQLLFDGVLSQYNHQNEIVVSFTIEAYFHHLLAKVLRKDERYQSADNIISDLENNKLLGLDKSISFFFTIEILNTKGTILKEFLNLESIHTEVVILPILNSFKIFGVTKTFNLFFEFQKIFSLNLLKKCCKKLEENEDYKLRNLITKELLKVNSTIKIQIIDQLIFDDLYRFDYGFIQKQLKYLYKKDYLIFDYELCIALGFLFEKIRDYGKSNIYYKKTLKLNLNENQKALCFQKIGWNYYMLDNLENGLKFLKKSLKTRLELYGKSSEFVAHSYNDLGTLLYSKGNLNKAIKYLNLSIDIHINILGSYVLDIGTTYNNLGLCYTEQKKYNIALNYFSKSTDIYHNLLGSENSHVNLEIIYYNIGKIYFLKRNYDLSIEFLKNSLICSDFFLGINHYESERTLLMLAKCYYLNKKNDLCLMTIKKIKKINPKIEIDYFLFKCIIKKYSKLHAFRRILKYLQKDNSVQELIYKSDITMLKLNQIAKQLNKENELPQWIKNIN